MADRDAEIKSLQEQLTEATKAKEALQSSQSDQNADVRAAGDSPQVVQDEVGRLRQEVLATSWPSHRTGVSRQWRSLQDDMIVREKPFHCLFA